MHFAIGASIMMVFVIAITIVIASILTSIHREKESYGKYLGTEVTVGKDTLIVIDYSSVKESFILSNGVYISKDLIITDH